jgi:hypothetical protein
MKNTRGLLGLLLLPVLAFTATSCSRDSAAPTSPVANESALPSRDSDPATLWGRFSFGVSGVMFVHASPDAPKVDIRLGFLQAADGLAFGQNTPYRFVLSGSRSVRVNVDNTSTTVISAMLPLAPRSFYTVFAANRVATLEPVFVGDDLAPPAAGKAHVRFAHLSPNAPPVDIAVANGGPVVFPNASFKDVTAFTPLPAGTYDLEVRLAGSSTVVLPLGAIRFDAGSIYTAYAKGLVGGSGDQALGAGLIRNSPGFGYLSPARAIEAAEQDLEAAPTE